MLRRRPKPSQMSPLRGLIAGIITLLQICRSYGASMIAAISIRFIAIESRRDEIFVACVTRISLKLRRSDIRIVLNGLMRNIS